MRIRGVWRLAVAAERLRMLVPEARRTWGTWTGPSLRPLRVTREQTDAEIRERLRTLLVENIVPFWLGQTVDPEGGFRQNHDVKGRWSGPCPKHIVGQARETWFFARLARSRYGTPTYREVARHGFDFLRRSLWDSEHGGFFWEVDATGKLPTLPDKHLYGQSFGLYALSEYTSATGDPTALKLADKLFSLMDRHAHDTKCGGYLQFLLRDWSLPPNDLRDYRDGLLNSAKTLDTHLHLLEALTAYCSVRPMRVAMGRLAELVLVLTNTTVHRPSSGGTDRFARDWTPFRAPRDIRVIYGHEVEKVWLLAAAIGVLGWSPALLRAFVDSTLVHAMEYGFDRRDGGLYLMGYPGVPADRREKAWWVQAEALVATLWMFRQSGDVRYRAYFQRTLDWVWDHQADWAHGDWHQIIDRRKRPSRNKAEAFKTPYHQGRAVLTCLEWLDEQLSDTPSSYRQGTEQSAELAPPNRR